MTDDRMQRILAKQQNASDRRRAEEEERLRIETERQKHERALLAKWDVVRNSLKKVIFELNKSMEVNQVAISYREDQPTHDTPHAAQIRYSKSPEYVGLNYGLQVNLKKEGLLTVSIHQVYKTIKRAQMDPADFDDPTQREWIFDFLELSADPGGTA